MTATIIPSSPRFVEPTSGQDTTDRLVTAWLLGYSSPNTRAAYRRDVAAWFAWCAERDVDPLAVQRVHVDAYARWLDEVQGRAASTVARTLAALSSFYDYVMDAGVMSRNPVARVRRPRTPSESQTLGLDLGEARAILNTADADVRDSAVVGLLLLLGLRASEVCSLDVADLGREQGHTVLHVTGKGGNTTTMPLPPSLAHTVTEHVGGRTDGPLVLDNDGGRLNRHKVARLVARVGNAAGIADTVTPHVLRHAMVTHALAAGVELHRVQDAARHADPRTTRRYDRQAKALDGHATYTLAAFLGG